MFRTVLHFTFQLWQAFRNKSKLQVNELSDAFAKTSCSCIEDWDYEQDERVKVSYSLNRRLKIWWMKLKLKIYEMIYWNKWNDSIV